MRKYILISPWSKTPKSGEYCAKNYPFWKGVIDELKKDFDIIQIGLPGEEQLTEDFRLGLHLRDIGKLLMDENCHTFISVDNFLPHLAHLIGKKGIVLWGPSDPNVFGYKEHTNLLKSRKYLRQNQFFVWDGVKHNPDAFVPPSYVIKAVNEGLFEMNPVRG